MLKTTKQTERQRTGRTGIYLGAQIAADIAAIAQARGWTFSATVRALLLPSIALERTQLARNGK
jgi:hypothetical protein